MSNQKTEPPFTTNKSLSPKLAWMNNSRIRLRFTGSCLREQFATFTPNNVENLFIVYELDRWSQDLNAKFNLKDCLFGAVKLRMLILINILIQDMELDLILVHLFQFQILIS